MADDKILRSYRSSEPSRRSAGPSGPGDQPASDPLAELARLIGQTDPFTDDRQTNGHGGDRRGAEQVALAAVPEWRKVAASMPPYEELNEPPGLQPDPYIAPADTGFARHDPYQMASTAEQSPDPYVEAGDPHRPFEPEPRFANADRFPPMHDERTHIAAAQDGYRDGHVDEPYYEDGEPTTPHEAQAYDDAPRPRRGSSLFTAVTLISCAMIGIAGAYGYRTYNAGPVAKKTPPVITAETTPSKVVASNDAQSTKVIQDRIGGQGPNERIVPREEQPVEMKPPGTSSVPRVVLPAPVAPQSQATFPAAPAAHPPPAPPSGAKDEPKRVRTVTIRPDGTDISGRPVGGIAPAGAAPAANGRPAPAAKQTPASRNGPLSLDPQTQASVPPPPPQQQARASVAPAVTPPAPRDMAPAPRLAAVPKNGGSGGYVVQLSSQRSEAEAQASYRSLQAKFPNQLGGHSPIVRRADLGAKGVYYRAMVGPFVSSGEASQLCSSLKAAGGQCIIQRN